MPFLVGHQKSAIRIDTNAVGCAESIGNDAGLLPIPAHFYQCAMLGDQRSSGVSCTFGVVEISFLISLKPHGKFMKMIGDLMITVEALIIIYLFITIQIM